jgi:uncharacterized protein with NRDE domain
MCLILLGWRMHPEFPVVLAANRDEFHERPTAHAAWWPPDANILAGRDLKAGGTWLGVSRRGRFAALTNFRGAGPQRQDARSRGELVTDVLKSSRPVAEILARLRETTADYNAFNILFSDGERLGIFESVGREGRELGPGIYGLSNHLLDTPWPKVAIAKSRLTALLGDARDADALVSLLRDDRPAADADLPRTGISLEWERLLSSAFIRAADYGTRCSTVFRTDRTGSGYFDEWTWSPRGEEIDRQTYQFEMSGQAAGVS